WGRFFLAWVFAGLLFHAAADKDLQIRRSYILLGALLLIAGIVFSVIRFHEQIGGLFLLGFLCFVFALLFILAALRHETEEIWRNRIVTVLGGVGAVAAFTAFIGGNIRQDLLYPYGVLLALTGDFYLWAFVCFRGSCC